MYAKEQKVKKDASSASGLRGLRGKRSAPDGEGREAAGRKDVFARSNKGVEHRSERDELERITQSKKRKAAERSLAAKSKLYEKMGERPGQCGEVSMGRGAKLKHVLKAFNGLDVETMVLCATLVILRCPEWQLHHPSLLSMILGLKRLKRELAPIGYVQLFPSRSISL